MSFLVDTNVFSEPVKPKPDAQVVAWLRQNESSLYVSTITIGEIRRGIEYLEQHRPSAEEFNRDTHAMYGHYYAVQAMWQAGGEHWQKLTNGIPAGNLGRIAVAPAPSRPSVVYALIEAKGGGLFRSDDLGEHWKFVNDSFNMVVRPFYFARLAVDPCRGEIRDRHTGTT